MTNALLDTSILVSLNQAGETPPDLSAFDELYVSSLCYSEMRMGLSTATGDVRQMRQDRLDEIVSLFGAGIPYDDRAALEYGRIVRAAVAAGKSARSHAMDQMIAGVARANGLALATRNSADLSGLSALVEVVEV
ncbi:PIN domain-containing protein [Williamsia maris]|uniref:PIN domain-containing protein n=1 Tax=Williamsia maris TaxID=72806 RepID=A0ABT1HAM1_9NOCA|nr:PIN domain-containing protein [Williamsia maris]MCP2174800.1 hypothetical protein [Williamsia maris]